MVTENDSKADAEPRPMIEPKGKWMNMVLLLMRLAAIFATSTAALMMARNKQSISKAVAIVGTTTMYQTYTAKFQQTPAFVFFVIANAIAAFYNLVVLMHRYSKWKAFQAAVHLMDLVRTIIFPWLEGISCWNFRNFKELLFRTGKGKMTLLLLCEGSEEEGASMEATYENRGRRGSASCYVRLLCIPELGAIKENEGAPVCFSRGRRRIGEEACVPACPEKEKGRRRGVSRVHPCVHEEGEESLEREGCCWFLLAGEEEEEEEAG